MRTSGGFKITRARDSGGSEIARAQDSGDRFEQVGGIGLEIVGDPR